MKKSDLITVILIAVIGTIAAFFLVNSILGDPNEKTVTFSYVANDLSELAQPDEEVFNSVAINPTIEVTVGSCVDLDQDGQLGTAELLVCGEPVSEDVTDAMNTKTNNGGASENENTEDSEVERTLQQVQGRQSGGDSSSGTSGGE